MRKPLHIDLETFSTVDLTKHGAYVYFDDPATGIYCAAYAFGDDGEPELWLPGKPCPAAIVEHVENNGQVIAWNAAFERTAWRKMLTPRHGWPAPKNEQFMCTMAEGLAMNLPAKLENAAPALGLDIRKDQEGHRLMLQMCKPRNPRKGELEEIRALLGDPNATPVLWWNDEERKQRLYAYCKQDVRTEQAVGTRVLRLRPEEIKLFHLDAKINDRGVHIDHILCHYAKKIVKTETARLDTLMRDVTDNEVQATSNVQQLVRYLQKYGVDTESVAKDVVKDMLAVSARAPDPETDKLGALTLFTLPDKCRKALEIRLEAAKTSTAKIDAMLKRRSADGRMRGNVQYHGAGTGRWAARGAQLQNLPRPEIIKEDDDKKFMESYDLAIGNILQGSNVLLEMLYGKPLTIIADCIRGMITAGPGNDLMSADFSNIEGRDTAWLAGQEDKLDAFRAFDAGTGPDLYLVAAGGVYGVPFAMARPFRQVGKVCELSLGFQGGPGAFANMAKNYGLKVGTLFDTIWERTEEAIRIDVTKAWDHRGKRSGMEERAWKAADAIKMAWRKKNWRIAEHWKELEYAAVEAFDNPGTVVPASEHVKYLVNGSFLWCRLPSGRALCYPYPRLAKMVLVEHPDGYQETMYATEAGEKKLPVVKETRPRLVFKSVDQWTKKWKEKAFYGGLAMENVAQAVARDVMAEAMLRVENAGYPVVLTVHDEIVVEVKKGHGSLDEFSGLMSEVPVWAKGLPVAAKGWRGFRYRKG